MARPKLAELTAKISEYIGIPYFLNHPDNPHQTENVLVGKGTAADIALKTIEYANQEKVNLRQLSSSQFYNFQKKHHLGIDCSGLVYHLLEIFNPQLDQDFVGTEGKRGVRRLSARLLTSPPNSFPVTDITQATTGDLIRTDSGKHVLFIIEADSQHLHYVHSSHRTKIKGVHYGQITILANTNLDQLIWSDNQATGQPYQSLFHPREGDGIFRPFFLK